VTPSARYASTHPHYTPQWLSERVALCLPNNFKGRVVDPACGAGNLLVAVALRFHSNVSFLGIDVSRQAVAECGEALAMVRAVNPAKVLHADYLTLKSKFTRKSQCAVVMNPPFQGYGQMSGDLRNFIYEKFGLTGRFNLSHAFVLKAILDFRPECLVAVLPSTWQKAKESSFSKALVALGGWFEWEDIGDAFEGIQAHVGILTWHNGNGEAALDTSRICEDSFAQLPAGFEVRQGVATGRDSTFREMAQIKFPGGRIVDSVVGRDVAKGRSSKIWTLGKFSRDPMKHDVLVSMLPANIRSQLRQRTCVKRGRRSLLDFHESFPEWFLGQPKILVPEIVSNSLRIEFDRTGLLFPLHSTFAVRVPTSGDGIALRRHFGSSEELEKLARYAPRLSGGAFRLTASCLRQSIARWIKEKGGNRA